MTTYNNIQQQVFNQDCSSYLKYCGYDIQDGERVNCPYRASSDSEAFEINGVFWTDHARNESGNVYQLALRMQGGNKYNAVKSLYESSGIFFETHTYKALDRNISDREKAEGALLKVKKAFGISKETTPAHVIEYLSSRRITERTYRYLAWIPQGKLEEVLSEEEISLTSLKDRTELLILWYFKGGKPTYYCTRSITEKSFKKAYTGNGVLEHPIWNIDDLYTKGNVIWGEGMFDCLSLIEIGYGCCGEITCYLIKKHESEILKALRWRMKNHPDWTFTICLDNDALTKDGRRPGNEAAEKIAMWLWGNAIDVKWVRHNPADNKIDINDIHKNGLENQIKVMLDGAKFVSSIIEYDESMCLRNLTRMIAEKNYFGAKQVTDALKNGSKNTGITIKDIIDKTHKILWKWQDYYTTDIVDIFLYGSDVYVIFDKNRFGKDQKCYEVFKKADFVGNMRRFQRNITQLLGIMDMDIPYKRPTWRVAKQVDKGGDTYNLFTPSPLLLQTPRENAALPEIWNRLLDNLAGAKEKEWLLNHLAVYLQTLNKPRTIPVFLGIQGSGKTTLATLLGEGIGGYIGVGNDEVEGSFNNFLMNAVVLLDELASNPREANQLKNKLKQLINERQTINAKHQNMFTVSLNNYIVIASNEQTSHVPLVVEKNDRRYSIITGGHNKDVAGVDWFDYAQLEETLPEFILYLLSRPADVKKASVPIYNETKKRLTETGEDLRVAYLREFMETKRAEYASEQTMKLTDMSSQLQEDYRLPFRLTSRQMRPILEDLGYTVTLIDNQMAVVITPVANDTPRNHDNNSSDTQGAQATQTAQDVMTNSPATPNAGEVDGGIFGV